MDNNDEIEVIFDEIRKTYHAIWRPPVSLGAGRSELDALNDLKQVIFFCTEALINSKCLQLKPGIRRNENC